MAEDFLQQYPRYRQAKNKMESNRGEEVKERLKAQKA